MKLGAHWVAHSSLKTQNLYFNPTHFMRKYENYL